MHTFWLIDFYLNNKKKFIFFAIIIVLIIYLFKGTKFDKEVWAESGYWKRRDCPRLEMADSIIKWKMLDGLTKAEVSELLGPPAPVDKFSDCGLVYWLGPERSLLFGIDSEWLCVDFDENQIVASYEIVRD